MNGLSHKFTIVGGKFGFTSGAEKATDDLHFYLAFIGWFRVYAEDFPADILSLIQKPTSYLETIKVMLLGRILNGLRKYVTAVLVKEANFAKADDRKTYVLGLSYTYVTEPDEVLASVTFIS